MKDYDAPEPAGRFDHLAMSRPGTVTAATVILGIGAVLAIIIGGGLLAALASAPADASGLGQARLLAGFLLFIGLVNGVSLILIARGYGAARVAVVVVGGAGVVIDIVTLSLTFGDALWALAVVLLFLPASNLFFSARATARAAAKTQR